MYEHRVFTQWNRVLKRGCRPCAHQAVGSSSVFTYNLGQPAFKAVELLKLSEFLSFDDFTAQLRKRFDSGKTKEDYKFQLLARCQKPNAVEDFEGFADSLLELVENAYPDTAYPFKVELARDQFIQGVAVSNDIREK